MTIGGPCQMLGDGVWFPTISAGGNADSGLTRITFNLRFDTCGSPTRSIYLLRECFRENLVLGNLAAGDREILCVGVRFAFG